MPSYLGKLVLWIQLDKFINYLRATIKVSFTGADYIGIYGLITLMAVKVIDCGRTLPHRSVGYIRGDQAKRIKVATYMSPAAFSCTIGPRSLGLGRLLLRNSMFVTTWCGRNVLTVSSGSTIYTDISYTRV